MPHYIAVVHGDDEGGYSCFFPDIPGAYGSGKTLRTMKQSARDGAELLIDDWAESGRVIPMPSSLDVCAAHEDAQDADAFVQVKVDVPEGPKTRVNVMFPAQTLAAIDKAAEQSGQSRSAFLEEAARQRIAREMG